MLRPLSEIPSQSPHPAKITWEPSSVDSFVLTIAKLPIQSLSNRMFISGRAKSEIQDIVEAIFENYFSRIDAKYILQDGLGNSQVRGVGRFLALYLLESNRGNLLGNTF